MNPAITNLGVMLVMSASFPSFRFRRSRYSLLRPELSYLSCQAIALAIYAITRAKICAKNDLTTLKYVEPANAMSGETEPKAVVTTVREYDLKQVNTQEIRSIFTSLAMMGFMHIYMKYTNPLVMQSISSVKSALEANIVKIHLFGTPATGDLKRPFKAAPGLMQALSGASTDVQDRQALY